jgi:hypothetical protein
MICSNGNETEPCMKSNSFTDTYDEYTCDMYRPAHKKMFSIYSKKKRVV